MHPPPPVVLGYDCTSGLVPNMGGIWRTALRSNKLMGIQNMNINSCLMQHLSSSALLTRTADIHTELQFHNRELPIPPLPLSFTLFFFSYYLSVKCLCAQQLPENVIHVGITTICESWLELHKETHDATWHLTDFLCSLWLESPSVTRW